MEEREIIEMENTMENTEECEERSKMSRATAIFIGSLIGVGGTLAARFAKRKWKEHKAKKECPDVIEVDATDPNEDSDDDE